MKYDTADDRLIRVGDAYKYWKDRAVTMTDNENARIFRMMMDEVPAAKPKTGQWILCQDGYGDSWVCSECGEEYVLTDALTDGGIEEQHYCPNCGAKMCVEEDEL